MNTIGEVDANNAWMEEVWAAARRRSHVERLLDKISKAETDEQLLGYAKQLQQVVR